MNSAAPFQDSNKQKFKAELSRWGHAYRFKTTSYLATNTPAGMEVLYARVELHVTRPLGMTREVVAPSIVVGLRVAEIPTTIDAEDVVSSEIEQGVIQTAHATASLNWTGHSQPSYYDESYSRSVGGSGLAASKLRMTARSLSQASVRVYQNPDLDAELKALTTPYFDLNDLLAEFGLAGFTERTSDTTIDVVAPQPAGIVRTPAPSLVGARLKGELLLAKAFGLTETTLGLICWNPKAGSGAPARRTESLVDIAHVEDNGLIRGTFEFDVPTETNVVLLLRYRTQILDQLHVHHPNAIRNVRRTVQQILDPELEWMRKSLGGAVTEKNAIEGALRGLLALYGLTTLQIPLAGKGTDNADIVGTSPQGRVVVVEVTRAIADLGKVQKLMNRANEIRKALAVPTDDAAAVLPILVCLLPRSSLTLLEQPAKEAGYVLAALDDVANALERAGSVFDTDQLILDLAKTLARPSIFRG